MNDNKLITKATIIIAYKNSCEYRNKNFNFVASLVSLLNIPLIIVEQVDSKSSKEVKVEKFSDHTHITYYKKGSFHKSKLYNLAFDYVETKYLWFLDADVVLPFVKVLDLVSNQELIRPMGDVHLLDEKQSNNLLDGKKIITDGDPPCRFFGKHSFIIRRDKFLECGMFDEKFVGWGWEDLDFIQTRAVNLDPFVFEAITGYHLYHPLAPRNQERDNYNTYLDNKNERKSLSICLSLSDFSNFNSEVFLKLLKENELLKDDIEFNVLILDNHEKFISWFKDNCKNFLFRKYLCLFSYSETIDNESKKANTCCYLSQGKFFLYINNLTFIPFSFVQEVISNLSKDNVKIFSDPNGDFMSFKRSHFNQFNGFDETLNLKKASQNIIKDSISLNKKVEEPNFGIRADLKYFDINMDRFISL